LVVLPIRMYRNWNNNRHDGLQAEEGQEWEWLKRENSGASNATSEADPDRHSDFERSRTNSTFGDGSRQLNRPIIQDESGVLRPEGRKASPVDGERRCRDGAAREQRLSSSSSSSSSSSMEHQNRNAQNRKSAMSESREADDKIARYIFYLIPTSDVPDLARLYQCWTEFRASLDIPAIIANLQRTMTENQTKLSHLIFRAFLRWDKVQDEEGAIGVAPEVLSGTNYNYYELFQEIKYMSSRLLSEVSYLTTITND